MIRLWWAIRYFNNFPQNGYWANYNDDIERRKFVWYLFGEKHFLEDWRDTVRRWYYSATKNQSSEENEKIQLRQHKQLRRINDLIDKALKRKYLLSPGDTDLKIDYRGRDFLKPFQFFKACLEEYDPIIRFILGGSLGAIIVGGVWLYNVFNS